MTGCHSDNHSHGIALDHGLKAFFEVAARPQQAAPFVHEVPDSNPLEQRQLLTVDPHMGVFMPSVPESEVIYEKIIVDSIDSAGQEDNFTIDLQAGQKVSVLADGDVALQPHIELLAPGGASLGADTAAAAAGQVGLKAISAPQTGTYSIVVTGAGDSVGGYGMKVLLNATLETETYGSASNDTAATAQNLDTAFVNLGGGLAQQAAVSGSLPGYSDGFEAGQLDQRWRTNIQPKTITEVTGARGAAEGTGALLLHWNGDSNDLDEVQAADWTVDLSEIEDPQLTFQAASWLNLNYSIRDPYEGYDNHGTGVAISSDGYHWYPVTFVTSDEFPDPTPWTEYSVDLAAEADAVGINLDQELQIRFQRWTTPTGEDFDGVGFDAIQISSNTENADWYQFSLNDGQMASVEYAGEQLGSVTVELYDSSMNLLTATTPSGAGESVIQQYVDSTSNSSSDTYFVKVAGKDTDYQLSVLRDAAYEATSIGATEPQELAAGIPFLGSVSRKQTQDATDVDTYQFNAQAGDNIQIRTTTPIDKSGYELQEYHPPALDPVLRLISPSGSVVATDDNGAGDNLNALLSHTATQAGTYTVEVERVGSTFGEYLLELDGSATQQTDFAVIGTTPKNEEAANSPTVYQVHLNREVLATTLDPSDLTIDGQPATGVRLVNGKTVEFTLPTGLTEKDYTAAIAVDAFTDIDGRGIPAFTSTLRPDFVSPHIISSSLSNGDSVALGDLTIDMQFNEALMDSVLDAGDVKLVGTRTGSLTPTSFNYNAATSTLTMEFPDLADDSYTLTLISGEDAFRDLVGHGLQDGDLTIQFSAQAGNVTLNNFQPIGVLGPQAYLTSAEGRVTDATADTFTVHLDAGETLSLLLEADSALKSTIEVIGPDNASLASTTASSAGQAVTLQNVLATQTGTYTIAIGGTGGSTGDYRLEALKNAVHEDSDLDEEAAENVDGSFRTLSGNQGEQLVVYGSLHALGESFESSELDDSWYYNSASDAEFAFFSDQWGSVDENTALMMHGPAGGVVWKVDVSEIENPVLSFWHASWEGAGQALNWYNNPSFNQDDGVVIEGILGEKEGIGGGMVDISTPLRVWSPPDQAAGEWVHYTIDLTELAETNGDPLTPVYKISFQQVDWYDPPGYGYVSDRLLPEVGRGWGRRSGDFCRPDWRLVRIYP